MNAAKKRLEQFRSSIPANDNGENWLPILKVITTAKVQPLLRDLDEVLWNVKWHLNPSQVSMIEWPIKNIVSVPDVESLFWEVDRLVWAISNVVKMIQMSPRYTDNVTQL